MDLSPEDAIAAGVKAGLLDVHTSMPARIVSYDDQTQRAVVRPCAKRVLAADEKGLAVEQLPDLPNVLVAWLGGGGFVLRFPLVAGDSGWLHFSETDSSGWERDGQPGAPATAERHGLGSPIFYPLARAPAGGQGHVVTPSPFVVGSATAAVPVACAPTTDARLDALEQWAATATFPTGVGPTGTAIAPLVPGEGGSSTASSNLQAEHGP